MVSESLANVAKHSEAAEATISARQEGDMIVVEVIDDGVGSARIEVLP